MTGSVTEAFLDGFANACNRHDIEAILTAMTHDAVMMSWGRLSDGPEAIAQTIRELFAAFPDAQWHCARHFIAGDRGVSEWTFIGTGPNGRSQVLGCDVFTFRDGKIAVKNSYRKQRIT
jgi:hypothetical protein